MAARLRCRRQALKPPRYWLRWRRFTGGLHGVCPRPTWLPPRHRFRRRGSQCALSQDGGPQRAAERGGAAVVVRGRAWGRAGGGVSASSRRRRGEGRPPGAGEGRVPRGAPACGLPGACRAERPSVKWRVRARPVRPGRACGLGRGSAGCGDGAVYRWPAAGSEPAGCEAPAGCVPGRAGRLVGPPAPREQLGPLRETAFLWLWGL